MNPNQNTATPTVITRRIGSTTYKLKVYFSENAKETLEDKISRMIQNEVLKKTVSPCVLAKKYTDFTELTTPMLNEFVEKILVHAPDRSTGERTQEVDIYLNFIGNIEVYRARTYA